MQVPRARLPEDIVRLIKQEFLEMPGLCLTEPQARRLWTLDSVLCDRALAELVHDGFLLRSPSGKFVRVDTSGARKALSAGTSRRGMQAIA